jgi:hypothetical protein
MPAIPSGAPGDRPAEASQRGRAMTASEAGAAIAREPMPGEGGPPPESADSVLGALRDAGVAYGAARSRWCRDA